MTGLFNYSPFTYMKNNLTLFIDKAKLLYKEFHHYTPNWQAIYLYIFERLERFDEHDKIYKQYACYDAIKILWHNTPNVSPWEIYTVHYTRKNKNSCDFKLIDIW